MGSPVCQKGCQQSSGCILLHLIPVGGKIGVFFLTFPRKAITFTLFDTFKAQTHTQNSHSGQVDATRLLLQAQVSCLEVECHPGRYTALGKNLDLYVKITAHCQKYNAYCCCQVAKLCLTLCNPMDCNMPGSFVLHYLLELTQMHVH